MKRIIRIEIRVDRDLIEVFEKDISGNSPAAFWDFKKAVIKRLNSMSFDDVFGQSKDRGTKE